MPPVTCNIGEIKQVLVNLWLCSPSIKESPDLLLGMDADPAVRNLVGVLQSNPELARNGIKLRSVGQQIIEILGGKRIHPGWVVPAE